MGLEDRRGGGDWGATAMRERRLDWNGGCRAVVKWAVVKMGQLKIFRSNALIDARAYPCAGARYPCAGGPQLMDNGYHSIRGGRGERNGLGVRRSHVLVVTYRGASFCTLKRDEREIKAHLISALVPRCGTSYAPSSPPSSP